MATGVGSDSSVIRQKDGFCDSDSSASSVIMG